MQTTRPNAKSSYLSVRARKTPADLGRGLFDWGLLTFSTDAFCDSSSSSFPYERDLYNDVINRKSHLQYLKSPQACWEKRKAKVM